MGQSRKYQKTNYKNAFYPNPRYISSDLLPKIRSKVIDSAQLNQFNGLLAYPHFTKYFNELQKVAIKAREPYSEDPYLIEKLSRDNELHRLSTFFGFNSNDGVIVVVPTAMAAVGWGIELCSRPESSVIVLDPGYPAFEELTNYAGLGRRTIHVDRIATIAVLNHFVHVGAVCERRVRRATMVGWIPSSPTCWHSRSAHRSRTRGR